MDEVVNTANLLEIELMPESNVTWRVGAEGRLRYALCQTVQVYAL